MAIAVFDNPYPERHYQVTIRWPELKDFDEHNNNILHGLLFVEYIPDRFCLNRESLRNYLEDLVESDLLDQKTLNRLLADLVNSCKPRQLEIIYAPESDRFSKTALRRSYRRNDPRTEE